MGWTGGVVGYAVGWQAGQPVQGPRVRAERYSVHGSRCGDGHGTGLWGRGERQDTQTSSLILKGTRQQMHKKAQVTRFTRNGILKRRLCCTEEKRGEEREGRGGEERRGREAAAAAAQSAPPAVGLTPLFSVLSYQRHQRDGCLYRLYRPCRPYRPSIVPIGTTRSRLPGTRDWSRHSKGPATTPQPSPRSCSHRPAHAEQPRHEHTRRAGSSPQTTEPHAARAPPYALPLSAPLSPPPLLTPGHHPVLEGINENAASSPPPRP